MASAHSTLGDALQAWRARVSPAAAGLPTGLRRRVPGLRREELAGLAGLSFDYLVRLEQGRATNPSPETIGALARALRLSDDERAMLYSIAGSVPPGPTMVPEHVPPGVQRMVDRLADTPVGVFTAAWTLIQWNALWAALLGDPSDRAPLDRNIVWNHFVGGGSRVRHIGPDRGAHERELVADIRIASIRYPDDRHLATLVSSLRTRSQSFETHWQHFDAEPRTSARKTISHPTLGDITLDCQALTVTGSDLRMIVFTAPPGTDESASLELLKVVGLQEVHS